jgi:choline dehydrogenase
VASGSCETSHDRCVSKAATWLFESFTKSTCLLAPDLPTARPSLTAIWLYVSTINVQDTLGSLIEEELSPAPSLTTDAELEQHVRSVGESIYHPVGTCKMGPAAQEGCGAEGMGGADGQAVVCPRLKVHGIEGLRVVDASVMPTIVSGNTNAATIMLAEKGADMILEDAVA